MKRILIFSLAYHPVIGGAEVAVKEITDRINDIEFDMITLRFDPSHPAEEQIGHVHVYRIEGSKNLFPFKALFLASKLHKQKSYDLVWAIMANWAGFAALFFKMKFPEVKYVLTLQEGDPIEYIKKKVWFVYPIFKNIFRRADTIQAISTFLGSWAKDMGYEGRVEVIPNGVDLKKFTINNFQFTKNTGETTLITTSRLVEKNGVGDIISALKYLPDNVRLKILGTGPLEIKLKQEVRSKNLESRVDFLGFVSQDEIPKYLHQADIFVRPSLSEGMGNSFIEAMAAGLPVIATPVGGIVDFLFDPDKDHDMPPTGLLVNVHNPENIALQVERLIKNKKLRETIVANARRMVKEKYDWGLIAEEMKKRVFNL